MTCEGLAKVLIGSSVVIDASNPPSSTDAAAMEFFMRSTANLLTAEFDAGVAHHVTLSVVGTDRLVPRRATQFFELLATIVDAATVAATVRLPPVLVQPIASADVARALAKVAADGPRDGIVEVVGPQHFLLPELVRRCCTRSRDFGRFSPARISRPGSFGSSITGGSVRVCQAAMFGLPLHVCRKASGR